MNSEGHTIDFLLRAKRDCAASRRFLERAMDLHGVPEKIAIDKSGANTAAIKSIQTEPLKLARFMTPLVALLDAAAPLRDRQRTACAV